ncbi:MULTISPECIES: hypothetical protein [Kordiimonas]|jgi:hypothetical protein|uniref:hypothetical protein n=1 Tax=Kordiimonas TaxID=288021 RepID=UPI002580E9F6|nr:hypothetical protein [Kordiimonas sp. UBA4487]
MQKLLIILTLIFSTSAACVADAEAEAEWITLPFAPAVGDTVRYQIRKQDIAEGAKAHTKPVGLTDVSIQYLGEKPDGHVYLLTYDRIRPEDPELAKIPAIQQMLGMFEGISLEYLADETGTPLAIRDMDHVRKWLLGPALEVLTKHETSEDKSQGIRSFFMNLGPEQAAEMLLKDITPIFSVTGIDLLVDEPLEAEGTVPWHMTGTELAITGQSTIIAMTDDLLTLEIRQGYSRESVLAGVEALAKRVLPDMPPEKTEEMQAQLQALKSFDVRQSIDATVSRSSGWPLEVKAISETDMGMAKRTITQEIKQLEATE